ncbi:hypothetical protein ACJMK2_039720 [Sinanodonta woodiana]|uniref:C3/C5 convertase n=1 Tax=Sinanodonta woodiana TaxID=1069815 RepID=A0ABD3WE19_SINWO
MDNLAFCFCIFTVLIQPTIVQAQECDGEPQMLEHGELVLHESKKYYTYQCDPGYTYKYLDTDIRRERVSCNNGIWMHSGDCRPVVDESKLCPPVPDLKNGITFLEGRNPGNTVRFLCKPGYTLEGSNERMCYDDFRWIGSAPECIGGERTVQGLAEALKKNFIDPNAAVTSTGEDESRARLSPGKNGLELYFLVDRSSSISEMNLEKAKKLMVQIMRVFNISSERDGGNAGTRVAVIAYAQTADILFDLDSDTVRSVDAFEKELSKIKAEGGGTNLVHALSTVRGAKQMGKVRNGTNKAIFVITDGKSTEGGETLASQAEQIKKRGYEIFALGIGDNVNIEELSKIASEKVQLHLFLINRFQDLADIANIIAEKKDFRLCGEAGDTSQLQSVGIAKEGAWPWLGWFTRISVNSAPVTCGGALVCDTWFLTAARCLHDDDGNVTRPEDIDLYLGVHQLFNDNQGNAIGTKPTGVFIHPNYNHSYYLMKNYSEDKRQYFRQLLYSEYDVALLQLNNASKGGPQLSPSIRPICLLRGEEEKGLFPFERKSKATCHVDRSCTKTLCGQKKRRGLRGRLGLFSRWSQKGDADQAGNVSKPQSS